jgi:uncharacterized protein (TIGR03032 family)
MNSIIPITASTHLNEWLAAQRISLAFTTYQTNRLFLIGLKPDGRLSVFDREFERPMGLFATSDRLVMSTRYQLWQFDNLCSQEVGDYLEYDKLYVPRIAYTTGDVNTHDLIVDKSQNWVFINTQYSCLATLDRHYSFRPIWQPPFISSLAAEDRCHLNGLAMVDGEPACVTACSQTDVPAGWRLDRQGGGCIIDIRSNEIICSGLTMPHSPRFYQEKLWVLNSGSGELGYVENGQFQPIAFCPGFVRGLAFHKNFAIVGLSKPRHDNFQGLALDDRLNAQKQQSQCGLMVVDLTTGNIVHWLIFEEVVKELFDIAVLPGVRHPIALGFQTDEIERLITFPGSNRIVSIRPGIHHPPETPVKITETDESVWAAPRSCPPPETAAANFERGRELQKQGLLEEAAACFQAAISLDANYIAAYNNLGNLRQLQGKIPEAIASYQQALQINPDRAAARCNLASAYLLQGNVEAAKAGYEETLRLDSNFYLAHLNLGKLHKSRGENDVAEKYFREVLRLKPDNAEARKAIATLSHPNAIAPPTQQPNRNRETQAPKTPRPAVKYQSVYHLTPDNAIAYEAFTFPSLQKRWQTHPQRGELFGISATIDSQMIGMVIAEILPASETISSTSAEILSLFVVPAHRHQGIGTLLVAYLENHLVKQGCTQVGIAYQSSEITTLALEPLLQKCGWLAPQTTFFLGQTVTEKIARAPWLQKYPLPEKFEIFPWSELTAEEKQSILARKEYPEMLSPFKDEARIEPLNSLGLRYQNEIVGWIVTHRVAEDTIRYSTLFILPKFQRMGRGISLLASAIKRQVSSFVPQYKFAVSRENAPMLQFVRRHLRSYLTYCSESRYSLKPRGGDSGSAQ